MPFVVVMGPLFMLVYMGPAVNWEEIGYYHRAL